MHVFFWCKINVTPYLVSMHFIYKKTCKQETNIFCLHCFTCGSCALPVTSVVQQNERDRLNSQKAAERSYKHYCKKVHMVALFPCGKWEVGVCQIGCIMKALCLASSPGAKISSRRIKRPTDVLLT